MSSNVTAAPFIPPQEVPTIPSALGWLGAVFIVVTLLFVNLVQTLSLILWPFSRTAFRKVNRGCARFFWGLSANATLYFYRIRVPILGESLPAGESALVICNHQAMSDIMALFILAKREKALGGMKWFVKESLKWVPGVGWGMQFLDCLFVSRSWETDASRIKKVFANLLRFRFPFWVISFSEGTRLTPEKLARSRAFSREKGLPELNHVLLPRTKGFVACITGLRSRLDAIYDVTLAYPEGAPSLSKFFTGRVHEIQIHVRRFPIQSIPEGGAELNQWLIQRFAEKDRRLAKFVSSGQLASSP